MIQHLLKDYPVLNEPEMEFWLRRIDRMARFYSDKAPEADEPQRQMFVDFVSALRYAEENIRNYCELTRALAESEKNV